MFCAARVPTTVRSEAGDHGALRIFLFDRARYRPVRPRPAVKACGDIGEHITFLHAGSNKCVEL